MRCGLHAQRRGCPRNCERRAERRLPLGEPGKAAGGDDPRARRPAAARLFLAAWRVSRVWRPMLEFERITSDQGTADTAVGQADGACPVTILVCRTCRDETGSDAHPRAGKLLAEATRERAAAEAIPVAEVECLG